MSSRGVKRKHNSKIDNTRTTKKNCVNNLTVGEDKESKIVNLRSTKLFQLMKQLFLRENALSEDHLSMYIVDTMISKDTSKLEQYIKQNDKHNNYISILIKMKYDFWTFKFASRNKYSFDCKYLSADKAKTVNIASILTILYDVGCKLNEDYAKKLCSVEEYIFLYHVYGSQAVEKFNIVKHLLCFAHRKNNISVQRRIRKINTILHQIWIEHNLEKNIDHSVKSNYEFCRYIVENSLLYESDIPLLVKFKHGEINNILYVSSSFTHNDMTKTIVNHIWTNSQICYFDTTLFKLVLKYNLYDDIHDLYNRIILNHDINHSKESILSTFTTYDNYCDHYVSQNELSNLNINNIVFHYILIKIVILQHCVFDQNKKWLTFLLSMVSYKMITKTSWGMFETVINNLGAQNNVLKDVFVIHKTPQQLIPEILKPLNKFIPGTYHDGQHNRQDLLKSLHLMDKNNVSDCELLWIMESLFDNFFWLDTRLRVDHQASRVLTYMTNHPKVTISPICYQAKNMIPLPDKTFYQNIEKLIHKGLHPFVPTGELCFYSQFIMKDIQCNPNTVAKSLFLTNLLSYNPLRSVVFIPNRCQHIPALIWLFKANMFEHNDGYLQKIEKNAQWYQKCRQLAQWCQHCQSQSKKITVLRKKVKKDPVFQLLTRLYHEDLYQECLNIQNNQNKDLLSIVHYIHGQKILFTLFTGDIKYNNSNPPITRSFFKQKHCEPRLLLIIFDYFFDPSPRSQSFING